METCYIKPCCTHAGRRLFFCVTRGGVPAAGVTRFSAHRSARRHLASEAAYLGSGGRRKRKKKKKEDHKEEEMSKTRVALSRLSFCLSVWLLRNRVAQSRVELVCAVCLSLWVFFNFLFFFIPVILLLTKKGTTRYSTSVITRQKLSCNVAL